MKEILDYFNTKDICDMFNIGRDTLRHYENIGLITPRINPHNGYREYGYWDVGLIIDILKYRSLGLSLSDSRKAIFDLDFPQLVDGMEIQLAYYEQKIKAYQMLLAMTRSEYIHLRYAEKHLGEITETYVGETVMVPFVTDRKSKYYELLRESLTMTQYFTSSWMFTDNPEIPPEGAALFTEKVYFDFLGLQGGVVFPASKVVGAVIDLQGKTRVSAAVFRNFEKEVAEKYPNAEKDTTVVLLSRFYDNEKRYHQYFFAFKKI